MEINECTKYQYNTTIKMAVIFTSILCLIPVNLLIIKFTNNYIDTSFILKTFTLSLDSFAPEQTERMQYIVSALLFPFFCFTFFQLFNKMLLKLRSIQIVYVLLSILSFITVIFLSYFDMQASHFFYLSQCVFVKKPVVSILVFGFLLILLVITSKYKKSIRFEKITKWLTDILCLCLVLNIVLMLTFSGYDSYITTTHFNAYFYSIVQVFFGKTLLVDLSNQYGFYPYFLEPLFKIIGLSFSKFSIVMGILLGTAFTCMYITLRKVINNRIILFSGFTSIVFFQIVFGIVGTIRFDYYFQYNPHRIIFPAVFVLLACIYFKINKPVYKKVFYNVIFLICSLSLLWNIDTGLIVYASWVAVLLYQEFINLKYIKCRKLINKCFIHITYALIFFICIIIFLIIYTVIRSGSFPNILDVVNYQRYFYEYGLAMVPMKLIHPWNLVILCYIFGLYDSIKLINYKSSTINIGENSYNLYDREKLIFVLSILGVGIFSYYQGRSHDYNLTAVWWPAFMLLTIYIDKLYAYLSNYYKVNLSLKKRFKKMINVNILAFISFIILFFFLSSSIGSIFINYSLLFNWVKDKWKVAYKNETTVVSRNMDFINSHTSHGEKVLILSYSSGIYYLKSQTTNPINMPGFMEIFLNSDYEKVIDYLKNTHDVKVFYERTFEYNAIFEYLIKYFKPDAASEDNSMFLFKKKTDLELQKGPLKKDIIFKNREDSLLHYKSDNFLIYSESGVLKGCIGGSYEQVKMEKIFSIELLVYPKANQTEYAHIIGNHPGVNNNEGFAIMQDGKKQNIYTFGYGDGTKWNPNVTFKLETEKWNYVVINVKDNIISAYVNGTIAGIINAGNSIKNSTLPLSIGNWINGNRPFSGYIDEVEISNNNITKDEIIETWNIIGKNSLE